jgi:hypothetical protein
LENKDCGRKSAFFNTQNSDEPEIVYIMMLSSKIEDGKWRRCVTDQIKQRLFTQASGDQEVETAITMIVSDHSCRAIFSFKNNKQCYADVAV